VIVHVYDPTPSPDAVAVFCTGVVFHEYVYGAVPPDGVAVAEPLLPPKQLTFELAVIDPVMPPVLPTIATTVLVQPFASVIVHVYDPAGRPVAVAVVCTGTEFHE
jgi:hypothetical protein